MYGTIARMRLKPGMQQKMEDLIHSFHERNVNGFLAEHIYRMDQEPNVYMMAVLFKNKELYFANANSAEQHQFYLRLLELLEGEPEWHDGEVVASVPETVSPG